jgi:hypothetical protein
MAKKRALGANSANIVVTPVPMCSAATTRAFRRP